MKVVVCSNERIRGEGQTVAVAPVALLALPGRDNKKTSGWQEAEACCAATIALARMELCFGMRAEAVDLA